MSFLHFLNLVFKNLKWLVLVPILLAVTIFYFTRKEKKVYASESTIYTGIASGYSLSGANKADFYSTSNAFDNLLSLIQSRETKQEVAVSLLAEHLSMEKHNAEMMTWASYEELGKQVPDSIRKLLVKPTLPETRAAILKYMLSSDDNVIYELLNSKEPYYSIDALNKIESTRINTSDLVKLSYDTNDPFICQRTLELLIDIFMEKYRSLREGQTTSVVDYFEAQTRKSFIKLDSVEKLFLDFNKNNDIINYYEQTKAVAGERENLYTMNHELEMDEMASGKALDKVNESIKNRVYQSIYGSEIINERQKLSDIYNKIANSEVINKDGSNKKELDSLRRLATIYEGNIKKSLTELNQESNTPNGIPTKNVLDEWLRTTLTYEQSKAKLAVMDKRKKEFTEEYRKFAPLGAILKKIERQINVSEQEYLQLLHDLNQAKLSQQNTELTSKLNVVDPPFLPLKPNPSKRLILVVVGFMVGFVLVLGVIIGRAFINKTLLEPGRARKMINLPLLGIYPLLNDNPNFLRKADLRLLQHVLAKIDGHQDTIYLGFISTQKGEGKSTIIDILEQQLIDLGYHVEKQLLLSNTEYRQLGISMPLSLAAHQLELANEHEVIKSHDSQLMMTDEHGLVKKKEKDFILVEFPALEKMVIKPGLFPPLNHSFLVCRANRIWDNKDKDMVSIFMQTTHSQPMFILNGVETDFAEEHIGEVPKKRSAFRAFIKKIVKFEFGNRKSAYRS
ncbi:GumC family protein [Emticicia soli]|uniref:GumC family protein n=1 Tax=Emticicia soli TaxID=2027878 RepID=A0ABW5JD38_9BACT